MPDERRLANALRRVFQMMKEDADATAKVVFTAFREEEEVNDEDLDKEVRALFYTLEKEQLLGVRRTEYKFEGQTRRAYFWRVNSIPEEQNPEGRGLSKEDFEAIKVYRALPQELWARSKA